MKHLKSGDSGRITAENTVQDIVSVVKELLENSLDAGANTIRIILTQTGTGGIEVVDDGRGIHKDDFSKLCQQGATSKLTSLAEIETIQTLGFRGQALFAISRIGKLVVCTRHMADITGYRLEIENGSLGKITTEGMSGGTIMKLTDIFNNNPVRLNDLRNRTQFYLRKIVELVESYSVINYDKKISLTQIDATSKRNTIVEPIPAKSIFNRLLIYIGKNNAECFKEYYRTGVNCKIYLAISNPQNLLKKKIQLFFLNKRLVTTPVMVKKTIQNCFKDFTYSPGYLLTIDMEKGFDVNVAADKMMAYFHDEKEICAEVFEVLKEAADEMAGCCNLSKPVETSGKVNPIVAPQYIKTTENVKRISENEEEIYVKMRKIETNSPQTIEKKIETNLTQIFQKKIEGFSKRQALSEEIPKKSIILIKVPTLQSHLSQSIDFAKYAKVKHEDLEEPPYSAAPKFHWTLEKIQTISKLQSFSPLGLNKSIENFVNIDMAQNFLKSDFSSLTLVGQFNKGFIIAHKNNNLFIIDQHAADEKYLFETLQESTEIHKQPLIVPKSLDLYPQDEILLENYLEAFSLNGFSFNFYSDRPAGAKFSLSALPLSKTTVFEVADLLEMIEHLKKVTCVNDFFQVAKLIRPKKFRDMFASRACRKAVMIGTEIDNRRMTEILNNLVKISQPWNCPHGRPTIRLLSSMPNKNSCLPKPKFNLQEF